MWKPHTKFQHITYCSNNMHVLLTRKFFKSKRYLHLFELEITEINKICKVNLELFKSAKSLTLNLPRFVNEL